MPKKNNIPDVFGPTFEGDFPPEMRTQMWPLCCGARIMSGFKSVNMLSNDELVEQINGILENSIPDFQIFGGEAMMPNFTFLTLNNEQMASKKIMKAIEKCGFKKIGQGQPRGHLQGWFLRDTSNTWKAVS